MVVGVVNCGDYRGHDEDDEEDEDGNDGVGDIDLEEWAIYLDSLCSDDQQDGSHYVYCCLLESLNACAEGDESACEELIEWIETGEGPCTDDDEGDDEEEDGEDDDEDGEEEEDDDEEDGDDEDGDLDELEELIELLTALCGSNQPNDLGIDPEMACGILELIEACNDGSEEACVELESLLEDLFGDEDEEDVGDADKPSNKPRAPKRGGSKPKKKRPKKKRSYVEVEYEQETEKNTPLASAPMSW